MNNGGDRRMTDEEYDDWLRGVEEAAAAKEDVDPPPAPYGYYRQRVQVLISNTQLYQAQNPELLIREMLEHYRFDLLAPITRAPVVNQDAIMFSGYMKEEDHDDADAESRADAEFAAYIAAYKPLHGPFENEVGGKISRRDLYKMLTRSGMLRTDTFPRSDDSFNSYWSPREDSDYWRSARKD